MMPLCKLKPLNPLVIYHGNCNDGSAAATCAYISFTRDGVDAEYYPATHGKEFDTSLVKDRAVYFLDFVFPRQVMEEIKEKAQRLVILDHHKSAQEDLKGMEFFGEFDMNRSGARLAFDYFLNAPHRKDTSLIEEYVNWVQDRDLWQYKLIGTKEINDYLFSLPAFTKETAELWEDALLSPPAYAIRNGTAISQYKTKQFNLAIERAFKVNMLGYEVWAANDSHLFSEVAGELAKRGPFGVCFYINEGKYVYSLRSRGEDPIDVSLLCAKVGGGGHKQAAGCSSLEPLHTVIR